MKVFETWSPFLHGGELEAIPGDPAPAKMSKAKDMKEGNLTATPMRPNLQMNFEEILSNEPDTKSECSRDMNGKPFRKVYGSWENKLSHR